MKSLSLGPDKFSHQQEAVPMPRTMSTGELGTLKIKVKICFASACYFAKSFQSVNICWHTEVA